MWKQSFRNQDKHKQDYPFYKLFLKSFTYALFKTAYII